MSVRSSVRRHRRALERAMTDRCSITREGDGQGEWNEAAGRHDDPPPVDVAAGPCLVASPEAGEQTLEVANAEHTLRTLNVALAHSVEGDVRIGDQFVVTESENPHLLDRSWWVEAVSDGSWSGSRHLIVTEEQRRG